MWLKFETVTVLSSHFKCNVTVYLKETKGFQVGSNIRHQQREHYE